MQQIILITGGSRGIGAATARLAAQRGYAVCVNYRQNITAAEGVVRDLRAMGASAISARADASIERDVVRLFDTCDRQLGTLTALVNNTALLETQMRLGPMDTAKPETHRNSVVLSIREPASRRGKTRLRPFDRRRTFIFPAICGCIASRTAYGAFFRLRSSRRPEGIADTQHN